MKQENRVFQNAKWILGCKIVQALIQLVIGMLTARYLGPSDYGLINYAASVTAFVTPLMQLGLQATLVQEYIRKPEKDGEILGTSLLMTVCSGFLSMVGVIGFSLAANWGEPVTILVCTLYSITLVCQAMELIQYWFHARMLSKYSSLAMLSAYAVASVYKVCLLISGKTVYWFALSYTVEYGIAGLLMIVLQRRAGGQPMTVSRKTAVELLSRSRYYIFAALMLTVFHNTDHIMLKIMSGNAENGFYTTAITCASIANFLYYGITDAFRPVILESRKTSETLFERNITRLYGGILWLSLAQSVGSNIFAKPIVYLLYGREYMAAVPVFRILVWQLAFANAGIVRNIWILGTERHKILWKVNLCGVVTNVILNGILIPAWGACGAAFASVVTQFFTNYAMGFVLPQLRQNNQLMIAGLHPRHVKWLIQQCFLKRNGRDSG